MTVANVPIPLAEAHIPDLILGARKAGSGARIEVRNVCHRYKRAHTDTLTDISLDIAPGEAIALIGRSGCGKSTLLHIMAGLTKPASGSVVINDEVVIGPSPRWVMMFQQPSLYPWTTVADNVALGLRFNRRMNEAPARVGELLDLVELSGLGNRNVQELSGGQQQRVALARSLALSPEVLLLDEPFSALDAFTRTALQRDVRRIARKLGLTLVLVTHDVDEAASIVDRAFVMTANPGRITQSVVIRSSQHGAGALDFEEARKSLVTAYEQATGLSMTRAGSDWSI